MKIRKERDKGSLTIEAALITPIFIFALFGMLQFLGYLRIYDRVQTSVNDVARVVSKSTFILGDIGLDNILTKLQEHDPSMNEKKLLDTSLETFGVAELVDPNFSTAKDKLVERDIANNSNKEFLKSRFKENKNTFFAQVAFTFMESVIGWNVSGGANGVAQETMTKFIKNVSEGYLECEFDDNLDKYGFVKMSSGKYFDLDGTKLELGENDEVEIVVSYRLKLPTIFGKNKSLPIKQRVALKLWVGA